MFPRTLLALSSAESAQLARVIADVTDFACVPGALARRKWEKGRGFAPDLAELEYQLRLAALAPEAGSHGFERVATASEPDWYGARFRFDPAHRLLESEWPLDEAYERPRELHERRPGTYLIYREAGRPRFRALGWNETALLRPLVLGVPLGRVLEKKNGPDFDAPVFQRWIETGLLRAIDWAAV